MRRIRYKRFAPWVVVWCLLAILAIAGQSGDRLVAAAEAPVWVKPTGYLTISLESRVDSSPLGQPLLAELRILPKVDVAEFSVTLETAGDVVVNDSSALALSAASAGNEVGVTASYTVNGPGEGELRATVEAFDESGELLAARTDVVYMLAGAEEVLFSTGGPLELQLKQLERSRLAGQLSGMTYQDAVERVLGGGAAEVSFVGTGANSITISGQIRWTDSAGGTHPVRLASVEIRDDELIGSELVTTVTTDLNGNYSATVDNDDGLLQDGRDIFIRVLAEAPGFTVQLPAGTIHRIDSSVHGDLADGTALTINLTANNSADNNTAFSVHDALVTVNRYIPRVNGTRLPDIDVVFPTTRHTSLYDGSNIHLLRLDRFDWDVIQHEYGHYVQDELNIANSPGGPHGLNDNLGEPPRGKDQGIRLAWGEGWPTYFGTTLQQIQGAAAFGIPNVGDTRYQDTEDTSINYDVESSAGANSNGEDNELSVQRILWDVYDGINDAGDQGVAFGDINVWNIIDAADPTTLSAAYQALIAGRSMEEVARIGCILTEHNVAPEPTVPADGSAVPSTPPPTFQWTANGGGPSNLNDRFVVEVYDAAFSTLLFASAEQAGTSFTPTQSDWNAILGAAGSEIHWLVKGRQTNAPATGPYSSCARRVLLQTPTAEPNGPYTGQEGVAVAFDGNGSSDPLGGGLVYNWEFGDGTAGTGPNPTHTYADDGSYAVCLTIIDVALQSDTKCTSAEIANVPPTVEAGPDQAVNEGDTLSLASATFTDPGVMDAHSATIDWGDGSPVEPGVVSEAGGSGTVSSSHVYGDDGIFAVTVAVCDEGDCSGDSFAVTVINLPPVVDVSPNSQSVQYSDYVADVTFTATDVASDPLSATTRWSVDGGSFAAGLPDGMELAAGGCTVGAGTNRCTWTLGGEAGVPAGVYTVRVTVADDDGGQTAADIIISVSPEDAMVTFAGDSPDAVRVVEAGGNSAPFFLTVYVSETQPDEPVGGSAPGDIGLARVSMRLMPLAPGRPVAGTCTAAAVAGSGYDAVLPVTCSFDGVPVNAYTAHATVRGGYYGGYGEATEVLMVYDPSLGSITGAGWFYWPGTSDRTNFGYSVKYSKQGQRVRGSLLLTRHLPNGSKYRVKSSALYGLALGESEDPSFGWAVFRGRATYRAPGSSHSQRNYEFLVYVEDWDKPGKGSDQLWIEVRDGDGQVVAAMSMPRSPLDNSVQLQRGSIVVPHAGGGRKK